MKSVYRSKSFMWIIISVVVMGLGMTTLHLDKATKKKPVSCTIIGKQIYQGGYKSSGHNTIALRSDNNQVFDMDTNLAYYTSVNVGDKIVVDRMQRDIDPTIRDTLTKIGTAMLVVGAFGLLISWLMLIIEGIFQ